MIFCHPETNFSVITNKLFNGIINFLFLSLNNEYILIFKIYIFDMLFFFLYEIIIV